MQEKHLYEYAVVRIVPRVEREEFINVGIILFSKYARYIKMKYQVNEEKLNYWFSDENKADFNLIYSGLEAFEKIASGHKEGGRIAQLDIPERFRWLTSVRSSMIQTSRPHPGFSSDLDQTMDCLFSELVL